MLQHPTSSLADLGVTRAEPTARSRAARRTWTAVVATVLVISGCSGEGSQDGSSPSAVSVPLTTGLHTFTSGGDERSYYLDLPEGWEPEDSDLPLVLALHGTGGTHAKWLDDTYNLSEAVGKDAIMVYPEALPSAAGTHQWVIERDLPYVEDLLDLLAEGLPHDKDKVLVTGQSSGAGMSHEIGCQLGDRVRAIAPNAGVLTATECTGAVAVIQVQGTSDPVVPFGLAQQTSQFWARYNGLGENATEPGAHAACLQYPDAEGTVDATNPHPVHLCLHNEGAGDGRKGHAWSSISGDAIWSTFTALPDAEESTDAPPGGGNAKALAAADTTATFTVRFPEKLPSTPTQGAVVIYAGKNVTPTTAPVAFMTLQFAPGAVSPGEEVTYTTPVSYSAFGAGGFEMPGTYTVMVTMHTEDGGYPIPVPGVDMWSMTTHDFTEASATVVLDGVLQLEPIAAETGL